MNKIQSHNSETLLEVFNAVQECRAKPDGDPQRIIVLLAPSRFNLPQLYCELLRRRGAIVVQAGQMDRQRLEFLKLLAHRTRIVPLVLASAEVWRRWTRRRTIDAAQIRRRTHLLIELDDPYQPAPQPTNQERLGCRTAQSLSRFRRADRINMAVEQLDCEHSAGTIRRLDHPNGSIQGHGRKR